MCIDHTHPIVVNFEHTIDENAAKKLVDWVDANSGKPAGNLRLTRWSKLKHQAIVGLNYATDPAEYRHLLSLFMGKPKQVLAAASLP